MFTSPSPSRSLVLGGGVGEELGAPGGFLHAPGGVPRVLGRAVQGDLGPSLSLQIKGDYTT